MWGGDHLNSAIHQGPMYTSMYTLVFLCTYIRGGSEKFYSYSRGITKNLQNLKNFQAPPLLVKNDTSLTGQIDTCITAKYPPTHTDERTLENELQVSVFC